MKRIVTSLFLLVNSYVAFAQPGGATPYPYSNDFNLESAIGGQLPNWTQTATQTFSTYGNHGTNGSIGLTKNLNNFTTVDSIATLQIGPLTALSSISFDYRIVDASLYPATATALNSGFSFKVIADVATPFGSTRYNLFNINQSNHTASASFVNKFYQIPTAIGSLAPTVYVWFVVNRGTSGDFYVDIDNLFIGDNTSVGIQQVENAASLLKALGNNQLALESSAKITNLTITSVDGRTVFTASNYNNNDIINLQTQGIYIVQFNNGGVIERRKVSIQ